MPELVTFACHLFFISVFVNCGRSLAPVTDIHTREAVIKLLTDK